MNPPGNNTHAYLRIIRLLLAAVGLLLLLVIGQLYYITFYLQPVPHSPSDKPGDAAVTPVKPKDTVAYWQPPDTASLARDDHKALILYGRDLIVHTSHYFGAEGTISRNAINGMNCQNCHLDAGTRIFGNNYGSVAATYPKYRARSGGIESIYKRINDCFERSLNGQPLDTASTEMQAITAYINWLGKEVPKGETVIGAGLKDIKFMTRAADPGKGQVIYTVKCQSCHQADGSGQLAPDRTAYQYPPLWGDHSYNDGAGLYRVSNFAKYVRCNMPCGIHYDAPQLTDEEAWDVSAYVNSRPRPHKIVAGDWPHIEEKPFDHPFGPYADSFSEQAHKYGPYQAIKAMADSYKKRKAHS